MTSQVTLIGNEVKVKAWCVNGAFDVMQELKGEVIQWIPKL